MYPALAVAEAVRNYHPDSTLHFVGSKQGFERPLLEHSDVVFDSYDEVRAGPLHGVSPLRAAVSVFQLLVGIGQSLRILRTHKPGVILMTGGWVSFPIALAGKLLAVPMVIFVPDIEPALSIKVLRHLAARIAVAIPESKCHFREEKVVVVGYPLRGALLGASRDAALTHFGLDPTRKTLLVFGGSRGARTLNTAVVSILPQLFADGIQVIHISGTLDHERVQSETASLPDAAHYRLFPYLHDEMGLALAGADLVLSRSGAGVLGEFPLFELPSVLVPYPFAWRYQKVNADYLTQRGAAVTIVDEEMAEALYPTLRELFANEARLAKMRASVGQLAQPDSARRTADLLAVAAREG